MKSIDYKDRLSWAEELIGNNAMVVFSQPEANKNSDVDHPYRQESFFYYLTGVVEPECALVLVPEHDGSKRVLFVRPRDLDKEIWNGKRLGVAGAKKMVPVDEVFEISELEAMLPKLLKRHDGLYYSLGFDTNCDRTIIDAMKKVKNFPPRTSNANMELFDAEEVSQAMRHCKSEEEIERMQKAANISKLAFDRVFKEVKPGMNERQVHGMLISEFYMHGGEMEAYNSIVAGGSNACCLHYVENNAELKDHQLLLVDAGAQYDYYASDVTRTFPVGSKFTKEQKELYEIVLKANEEAICVVKPGSSLIEVHKKAVEVLVEGLLELGIVKGHKKDIIDSGSYKRFYPHSTGHWLGMDVHDVGASMVENEEGELIPTPFEIGMVITVEPGLYMQANDTTIPEAYRGIGIRIEDDIVVTEDGYLNLTKDIPKSVEAMENRL